ncbi:hypothetical protein IEQ34_005319 [Dendrobium chrysotoxum]|uniref:Uncharacterized protein n=1 Tax=Dendrobium chrysotoxum TaxID=161865 RepID=A0AAV7H9H5_DENCH|nr:hypothetical protein IEQ34_005319 [Dendrobium chrysotoxum]
MNISKRYHWISKLFVYGCLVDNLRSRVTSSRVFLDYRLVESSEPLSWLAFVVTTVLQTCLVGRHLRSRVTSSKLFLAPKVEGLLLIGEKSLLEGGGEIINPRRKIFNHGESNREHRFGRLEEMMKKLIEMKSKTPLVVLMANPNHNLIEIPLAEFKGKEIGLEEFEEESFFHQEPPPGDPVRCRSGFSDVGTIRRKFYDGGGKMADHYVRRFRQREWAIIEGEGRKPPPRASIKDGIGFLDGGIIGREFHGGGGGVADHYGRSFGQGEWATQGGGGQVEPCGSGHVRRVKERWDYHPRYIGEIWKDYNNRYTGGGRKVVPSNV